MRPPRRSRGCDRIASFPLLVRLPPETLCTLAFGPCVDGACGPFPIAPPECMPARLVVGWIIFGTWPLRAPPVCFPARVCGDFALIDRERFPYRNSFIPPSSGVALRTSRSRSPVSDSSPASRASSRNAACLPCTHGALCGFSSGGGSRAAPPRGVRSRVRAGLASRGGPLSGNPAGCREGHGLAAESGQRAEEIVDATRLGHPAGTHRGLEPALRGIECPLLLRLAERGAAVLESLLLRFLLRLLELLCDLRRDVTPDMGEHSAAVHRVELGIVQQLLVDGRVLDVIIRFRDRHFRGAVEPEEIVLDMGIHGDLLHQILYDPVGIRHAH